MVETSNTKTSTAPPDCAVCGKGPVVFRAVNGNYFCEGCGMRLKLGPERRIDSPIPMVDAAYDRAMGVGVGSQAWPAKAAEAIAYTPPEPSFLEFVAEIDALIKSKAQSKGYSRPEEANPGGALFTFVSEHFHGHPVGEIVYKAVRYASKGKPEDLVKIAAWAYLVWANRTWERVVPTTEAATAQHSERVAPAYDTEFHGAKVAADAYRPGQFVEVPRPHTPADFVMAAMAPSVNQAGGAVETFDRYQVDVVRTISHSPADWPGGLLTYHALGVAEEAGEVVGVIKKAHRTYTPLTTPDVRLKILKELGDALWYITAMCHDMGVGLKDVAQINILKRRDREDRGVIKGEGDDR